MFIKYPRVSYFAGMLNRSLRSILAVCACIFSIHASAQTLTTISGHLDNTEGANVKVSAILYALDLIEGSAVDLVPELNSNGDFKASIGFDRPFYVRYLNNNKLLKGTYVMPGDNISLSVGNGGKTLSGTNTKLLKFLGKLNTVFENAEVELNDTSIYKGMDRVAFMNAQKARRDRQLRYVVEYFVGLPPLDQQMRNLLEAEINYSFGLKMLRYSRIAGKDRRFVFRYGDYMSAIEEVISSNPDAMISTAYAEFVYELPFTLWYSEVNWTMQDKPPYKGIIDNQYTIRDSIARKYFTGEVYELALYAILLDVVKATWREKSNPAFDKIYANADRVITDMGRSFTNRIYYSRIKARLEEVNAPEKKEQQKPKPKAKKK
jgi:hypothetical protein